MHILISGMQFNISFQKCFMNVLFHMLNYGVQLTEIIKLCYLIMYKLNIFLIMGCKAFYPLIKASWSITKTILEKASLPWLMRLSGLSAGLWTRGSLVQFPVRAHAWVVNQVPIWGHTGGNHTLMFLSLSFSLPFSENK